MFESPLFGLRPSWVVEVYETVQGIFDRLCDFYFPEEPAEMPPRAPILKRQLGIYHVAGSESEPDSELESV